MPEHHIIERRIQMILCSKVAFLNVLKELMTTQQILEATYYVPDSTCMSSNRGRNMKLMDRVKFNEYGQIVHEKGYVNTTISSVELYSYCPTLDPLSYSTSLMEGLDKYSSRVERYVETNLKKDRSLNAVYDFLIKQPPRGGNGERIMIYEHYESLWEFGHAIAEYLSTYFGFDIIYLDRIYNPYIRGKKKYIGNPDNAKRTIEICRDRELVQGTINSLAGWGAGFGIDENVSNIDIYLNGMKWEKLQRLYELLFPDEPLPADYYTESRLREILKGKIIDKTRNMVHPYDDNESIGVVPMDYQDAIDSAVDDSMDDLHYMY